MLLFVEIEGKPPAIKILVSPSSTLGAVACLAGLSGPCEWNTPTLGSFTPADPAAKLSDVAADLGLVDTAGWRFDCPLRLRPTRHQGAVSQRIAETVAAFGGSVHVVAAPGPCGSGPLSGGSPKLQRKLDVIHEVQLPPSRARKLPQAGSAKELVQSTSGSSTGPPAACSKAPAAAPGEPNAAPAARDIRKASFQSATGSDSPSAARSGRHDSFTSLSDEYAVGNAQAESGATELQGAAAPAAAAPDVAAAPAAAAQPDPIDLKAEAGKLRKELELLVAGSHIAVVDGRRAMRDAIVAALARRLPRHFVKATGRMQAFRVVHLSFDQCTFSQGLDGFWRWVLASLHGQAPDLFPASSLLADAGGFEEAFSEDRLRGAPPVVLLCGEACRLADASSWFASRFLGTLRDMGSERHRYFLHAVSLVGGDSLERVDMALYQAKVGSTLSNMLQSSDVKRAPKARAPRTPPHSGGGRTAAPSPTSTPTASSRAGSVQSGSAHGSGRDGSAAGRSQAGSAQAVSTAGSTREGAARGGGAVRGIADDAKSKTERLERSRSGSTACSSSSDGGRFRSRSAGPPAAPGGWRPERQPAASRPPAEHGCQMSDQ